MSDHPTTYNAEAAEHGTTGRKFIGKTTGRACSMGPRGFTTAAS